MTKRRKVKQTRPDIIPKNVEDRTEYEEPKQSVTESYGYSENPLEEPGATHLPASAMGVPVSSTKVEKINSTAKIDQINRVESELKKKQIDQTATQIKQSETEIKNSVALRKVIEGLLKEMKGGSTPNASSNPETPKIQSPTQKDGIRKTIAGAVGGNLKDRIVQPLKTITTAKGLTGLVASRYAGNPNSIVGAIANSLYERESIKQEEKEKSENFHTGFTQGTDAGRNLLEKKRAEALAEIKEKNPGLTGKKLDAAVNKKAEMETRKETTILYEEKKKTEDKIAEITTKEKALQTKDKLFGLSKEETADRDHLIAQREKIVKSGTIAQPKRNYAPVVVDSPEMLQQTDEFDKLREKKKYELESFHERKLTDEEMLSIDKSILEQLELIAGAVTAKPEKDEPNFAEKMQEADKKLSDTIKGESEGKTSSKERKSILERSKDAGKGFLGKGKDLLGKGLEMGGDLLGGAGKILGKAGSLGTSLLGGLSAGALATAALVGTSAAGVGQMVFGKEGLANGGRGTNFINDLAGGDGLSMAFGDMMDKVTGNQKFPEPTPTPKPIVPVQMEKEIKDTKPKIDEKAAAVEAEKKDKPIIVNVPPPAIPIINNSSTTNVMRTPVRNQEPSFMRSLHNSFV